MLKPVTGKLHPVVGRDDRCTEKRDTSSATALLGLLRQKYPEFLRELLHGRKVTSDLLDHGQGHRGARDPTYGHKVIEECPHLTAVLLEVFEHRQQDPSCQPVRVRASSKDVDEAIEEPTLRIHRYETKGLFQERPKDGSHGKRSSRMGG